MKLSSRSGRHAAKIELQMTSMIDVVFLLLIFFMVTSSFRETERELDPAVKIERQSGAQAADLAPTIIRIVRSGGGVRTTVVNVDGRGEDRVAHVVSGIKDLVVLKSTGSEFHGFLKDEYTTLQETTDRILATSLVARWRYDTVSSSRGSVDWDKSYDAIRALLLQRFAEIHSLALQQTLHGMGTAVLEQHADVAEIRFSAPNKHHFLSDLSPFGLDNPGEVFFAADRPYGLIEASVVRDEAPDAGSAWHAIPGFC